MRFSQIVETVGGEWINRSEDTEISQINIDSRHSTISDDQLFIAIKGPNYDAHNYIPELIANGIKHFIVEKSADYQGDINICQVNDSIEALQALGKSKREQFKSPVIGITGSNGKTIVKEWLYEIVSKKLNTVKSPKSYNSQIGVPLSLWHLEEPYELAIIETGISMPGEMTKQETMVRPDLGIFTNIGSAHGENFNTTEEKVHEKAQLFKRSKKVICSDHKKEVIEALRNLNHPELVTWGESRSNNYQIKYRETGLDIYNKEEREYHFSFNASNFIFLENICHVIVAALELGINDSLIQEGIDSFDHSDLRLSIKRGSRANYIVDDTYNNDLEGLKLALDFLELQNLKEDRVLILSDLVQTELGTAGTKSLNRLLDAKKIKELIVVGHQLKGAFSERLPKPHYFDTTEELLESPILNELEHKLILVKGSRQFKFERVVSVLSEKIHKTRLEIDLNAIQHNLTVHKKLLRPNTKLMVMVKAFGYGAGSHELARLLQYQKVDYLGVAYVDEGIALRNQGITTPIMVMNATTDTASDLLKYQLEPEIYDAHQLITYLEYYSSKNQKLPCHLILNTGMNRLGFEGEEIESLIELLANNSNVEIKSIFTHLAAADEQSEKEFTLKQIERFDAMARQIKKALKIEPLLHCLNSAGIVNYKEHQKDMVRLGIGLHGMSSNKEIGAQLRFPAKLKSVISQIRRIKKGETIGYGRVGKAEKDMTIATVAIGYADGYSRSFSNGKAYMLVKGQKAPTIGNICMDMCMIDVTGIDIKAEDEVIVFGDDPSIEDLAHFANTIPYEILTNVSERVQRIFHVE